MDDRVRDGQLTNNSSKAFIAVSIVGVGLAIYHAWLEGAFTTKFWAVHYSTYASFAGIPYWVCGVVWFPLVLIVGSWSTKVGRAGLKRELIAFLTVGNIATGYFWYLDIMIVKALTFAYIALYVTNYVLTALVVIEHRSEDVMQGYVYGTVTGCIVGLLFGPYGVVACGIGGGIFGAARNFVMPKRPPALQPQASS